MKLYFVMNSINDAHANKRASDFKAQGHEVRQFGFLRHEHIKYDNGAEIIGNFTNDMSYASRVGIYLKGLRNLFRNLKDKEIIWYYQGIDVALFATVLNPRGKYIYEECDLAHTNIHPKWLLSLIEHIDKRIIKKSAKTVVTSEGFIQYHYGKIENCPKNVILIPNKLSPKVLCFPKKKKKAINISHIRFAFVGSLRYPALLNIADIISREFPFHEFHFYGFVSPSISEDQLPRHKNIFYHGAYKSPEDLPQIYADIDILISTYDTTSINVRFAEPNKLYEAMYFGCPIVVSTNTFLAEKVKQLCIGYDVNPYIAEDIKKLVKRIESDYFDVLSVLSKIKPLDTIDNDLYVDSILSF